jgi:DNA-binding NarL/FixJ family response regulator
MAIKRVALIAGQSLLLNGMASRLHNHAEQIDVELFDPNDESLIRQLQASPPSIIVMDAHDPELGNAPRLTDLFRLLPSVQVMMLTSERSDLHIISSRHIDIHDSEALFEQIMAAA